MTKEIKNIIKNLENMQEENFKTYVNMKEKTADYFLLVGICDGIGRALTIIERQYK